MKPAQEQAFVTKFCAARIDDESPPTAAHVVATFFLARFNAMRAEHTSVSAFKRAIIQFRDLIGRTTTTEVRAHWLRIFVERKWEGLPTEKALCYQGRSSEAVRRALFAPFCLHHFDQNTPFRVTEPMKFVDEEIEQAVSRFLVDFRREADTVQYKE
jgi:hypothetical protein